MGFPTPQRLSLLVCLRLPVLPLAVQRRMFSSFSVGHLLEKYPQAEHLEKSSLLISRRLQAIHTTVYLLQKKEQKTFSSAQHNKRFVHLFWSILSLKKFNKLTLNNEALTISLLPAAGAALKWCPVSISDLATDPSVCPIRSHSSFVLINPQKHLCWLSFFFFKIMVIVFHLLLL